MKDLLLTIVVPCYNEEAVLHETATRLQAIAAQMLDERVETHLLFVDDGSRDATWRIIRELAAAAPNVHGLKLAHNAGHQHALWAGLTAVADEARRNKDEWKSRSLTDTADAPQEPIAPPLLHFNGEPDYAVVSIDADLQDDVHAIPQMVRSMRDEGADIVFGVRRQRRTDTRFKRWTALMFYRFMQSMGAEIVNNHADFRLVSLRALQALLQFTERNLFLRGLVTQLGFRTSVVLYDRAERFAGESKYPLRRMLAFALEGITSFSVRPLRIITIVGALVLLLSILGMVYALVSKIWGTTTDGWTSILLSIWFIGGVIVTSLGIIGEYIGKIYQEVKHRPRFIIEERV